MREPHPTATDPWTKLEDLMIEEWEKSGLSYLPLAAMNPEDYYAIVRDERNLRLTRFTQFTTSGTVDLGGMELPMIQNRVGRVGIVRARHFRPGNMVLFHNSLGMAWAWAQGIEAQNHMGESPVRPMAATSRIPPQPTPKEKRQQLIDAASDAFKDGNEAVGIINVLATIATPPQEDDDGQSE